MIDIEPIRVMSEERKRSQLKKFTYFYNCPICGNEFSLSSKEYNFKMKIDKVIRLTCSRSCSTKRQLQFIPNSFSNPEIKEKIKNISMDRYGVDNPSKSNIIKDKIKKTFNEKYDGKHPSQTDEIKNKKKKTCFDKYGSEYYFSSVVGKDVIKSIQFNKYGDWYTRNEIKKYTTLNGLISEYGDTIGTEKYMALQRKKTKSLQNYIEKYGELDGRTLWERTGNGRKSKLQLNVIDRLKLHFSDIEEEFLIQNPETKRCFSFDIKIKNFLIEVNGDYWHANPKLYSADDIIRKRNNSESVKETWKKDLIKKETAESMGFKVLYIWEYDAKIDLDSEINRIKEIIK